MKNIKKGLQLFFILFVALTICSFASNAEAVTVTTVVDSADVEGSLRWALSEVEDGGTISFDESLSGGVISLDSQLVISRDVIIEGLGPDQLSISGQSQHRIFNIEATTSADISGLSIVNGSESNGGAIYNFNGNLRLLNCILSDNHAENGGAIYYGGNQGSGTNSLYIENCEFKNNTASSKGGVIFVDGIVYNLQIYSSNFSNNNCNGPGGVIYGYDINNPVIESSVFSNNYSASDGGALFLEHTFGLYVGSCSFSANSADNGGAIYVTRFADYLFDSSYFHQNSATGKGGAININSGWGDITLDSCILSSNSVPGLSEKFGGAIYLEESYLHLKNSTLNNNSASDGGCIYLDTNSTTRITNSTISNNDAVNYGGGIYHTDAARLLLSNTTITLNDMDGSCHGSGIFSQGILHLNNTILAANSNNDLCTIQYIDKNIDLSGCNLIGFSYYNNGSDPIPIDIWPDSNIVSPDITSADIFSGGLADNGGPAAGAPGDIVPMLTLALKSGSPAIDSAASTDIFGTVVSGDQRGVSRPKGLGYDIGAYEFIYDPVYYIGTESSPGGYFDPVSADVLEGTDKTFTVTPYDGFLIEELFVDEQEIVDFNPEGYSYTFENVSSDLELRANFMIDPEMMEESGVEDIDVNDTTKGPQSLTDPEGITKDAVRSISLSSVSSSDIGGDLSDTDFATGLSFEIGFVSPDAGTAVTQLDLVMEISRDLLGAETCEAIDSGDVLETAFFENVSLYKIVSPDAYDLYKVASADFDATDFFKVYDDESNYYVSMSMVIADEAAPQEEEPVQALEEGQDNFFFVYDGAKDGKFTDPIVVLRKSSGSDPVDPPVDPVDPVDPPAEDPDDPNDPDDNGDGSCSVGTFTPLAALLLLPMLMMFKK